jgi:hypothetical protein
LDATPPLMNFNEIITRLRSHPGDPSITITTNAAHTYMDAKLVREHLKKLERAAEKLLLEHYDKRVAGAVIERSRELLAGAKKVNDMPGMAFFVNQEIAEAVHLPFQVNEGVTVGSTFHVRELLRTGLDSVTYHVLVLGGDEARLYLANDSQLVREVRDAFPLHNRHHTTDVMQVTTARGQENQERRFHQEVHEAVRSVVGAEGIVVPACVQARHGAFMANVDHDPIYQGHLQGNFEHMPPKELVSKAWDLVHAQRKRRHLEELSKAAEGMPRLFINAMDEVWEAVMEGRGRVLFTERDKYQAATLEDDHLVVMPEGSDHEPGFDLVDQLIEEQLAHGGEVRLLPNGSMDHYHGIALLLRY